MTRTPLVSIFIPVYNSERYVNDLMNVLLNQTYYNIEFVFVDDFSTDSSYETLMRFASDDSRIKVKKCDSKKGVASKVLDFGLEFCSGEYFFYMSQDDFMDTSLIEKCVDKAVTTDADLVLPNMVLYYGDKSADKEGVFPLNNDYDSILAPKDAFLLSLTWQIHGFMFVRMNLLKKVWEKALLYNSDEFNTRRRILYANKVAFADTNFYYRQDNPDALTKKRRYFHIDVLTTDVMLIQEMINAGFSNKEISSLLCHVIKTSFKAYGGLKGRFGKLENLYVSEQYRLAYKKLSFYCRKYCKRMLLSLYAIYFYRKMTCFYQLLKNKTAS